MTERVHHPEIEDRADIHRRYYRTLDPPQAIDGLCLRLASAELVERRLSALLAEARAEIAGLRAGCVHCQRQRFHDRHQTREELSAEMAPFWDALRTSGPPQIATEEGEDRG